MSNITLDILENILDTIKCIKNHDVSYKFYDNDHIRYRKILYKTTIIHPYIIYLETVNEIKLLPRLKKLTILSLGDIKKIKGRLGFCNGGELRYESYITQTLPNFSNLQVLHLGTNNQIQTLPNFPNLQILNLGWNEQIQTLPNFPDLKELYLGYNINIQTLPNFPNLQRLHIQR